LEFTMQKSRPCLAPLLSALAFFLLAPALAGAREGEWVDRDATTEFSWPQGWNVTLGVGGLYNSAWNGDDEYRLSVLPNIQLRYGDRFFASVQEGVGFNAINSERWRVGPIARLGFGRDEDGGQPFAVTGDDTTDLTGLDEIDTSIELGGFAEYDFGALSVTGEVRQALSGHEGLVGDVSARLSGFSFAAGPPLIWSVGPRARLVDDTYNEAFFSIDTTESIASGLPVFDAGGGLYSYGVSGVVVVPLDRELKGSLVFLAGYDRLSGDAADNPLVQQRGSEDQFATGVFWSYRFGGN
jgi:MipA family protein